MARKDRLPDDTPAGKLLEGIPYILQAEHVLLAAIYEQLLNGSVAPAGAEGAPAQESPVFAELVAAINKQTAAIEGLKKTQGESLAVLKAIRDRPTAKKTAAEQKAE